MVREWRAGGKKKNLCFFHLMWSAISQPYYWQNKRQLAQQGRHPLSLGLVAIVTRLGDECDILNSKGKVFDSIDSSPEAQIWPRHVTALCSFPWNSLSNWWPVVQPWYRNVVVYHRYSPGLSCVQIKSTLKSSQAKWILWGQQISILRMLELMAGSFCVLAVSL